MSSALLLDLLARRSAEARLRAHALEGRKQAVAQREARRGTNFNASEKRLHETATKDLREANQALEVIDSRIEEERGELERGGINNPLVQRVLRGNPAARVGAPMFDKQQVRGMHAAMLTGGQYRMVESRAVAIDTLIPPVLSPTVIGPSHDTRLLSRLPQISTQATAVDYLQHTATTGSAAIVAEGALKPELNFTQNMVTVRMQKFAAHIGVGLETLTDFAGYEAYVEGELQRNVTDVETAELLAGDGTTGHLTGFVHQSGILTHAMGSDTALDAIEIAIATMRTGAALASPDLMVVHPLTFSAIRRSKDSQNRYLTTADPTGDQAQSVWGVNALVTTACAAGTAVLIDTTRFGTVYVLQPLTLLTGTANDDMIRNIRRFVVEERLAIALSRPAAVCTVTGLPTA